MNADEEFRIPNFAELGKELERSGRCTPLAHGSRPRNVALKAGRMKTEEWKLFTPHYSIPLIEGRLGRKCVLGWKRFVEVCRLRYLPRIERSELQALHQEAILFFEHYEHDYYRYDENRLKFMRSAHHYLSHLSESIDQCGPLKNLDQSKIERYIGSLSKFHHANFRMAESMMKNTAEAEAAKHLELQLQGTSAFDEIPENLSYQLELPEPSCSLSSEEKAALQQHFAESANHFNWAAVRSCKRHKRLRTVRGEEKVSFRTRSSLTGKISERRNCYVIGFFGERKYAYGQLESVLKIKVNCNQHELVAVRWAERLVVCESGAVLSVGSPESAFTKLSVEPLHLLNQESPLGLMPSEAKNCVHFIDQRLRKSPDLLLGRIS